MPSLGLHRGLRNVYGCVICGDATDEAPYAMSFISNFYFAFHLTTFSAGERCSRGRRQWYAGSPESDAMGRHDRQLHRMVSVHVHEFGAFLIVSILNKLLDRIVYSYLIQVR